MKECKDWHSEGPHWRHVWGSGYHADQSCRRNSPANSTSSCLTGWGKSISFHRLWKFSNQLLNPWKKKRVITSTERENRKIQTLIMKNLRKSHKYEQIQLTKRTCHRNLRKPLQLTKSNQQNDRHSGKHVCNKFFWLFWIQGFVVISWWNRDKLHFNFGARKRICCIPYNWWKCSFSSNFPCVDIFIAQKVFYYRWNKVGIRKPSDTRLFHNEKLQNDFSRMPEDSTLVQSSFLVTNSLIT